MAKSKRFNIHDLYPEDYCFNEEAFQANPEAYIFTKDDIAYLNAMELERYEQTIPMSSYEKGLLRKWVASGHSPRENAGSKYICLSGSEPYDFLDVYRMDREIRRNIRGLKRKEQESYLKEYIGWKEEDPSNPLDDVFVSDDDNRNNF